MPHTIYVEVESQDVRLINQISGFLIHCPWYKSAGLSLSSLIIWRKYGSNIFTVFSYCLYIMGLSARKTVKQY